MITLFLPASQAKASSFRLIIHNANLGIFRIDQSMQSNAGFRVQSRIVLQR